MSIPNQNMKKSRYHKQSTKSCNEDNNPEEEELKKYRELIEKLGYNLQKNKTKDLSSSPYSDSGLESSHNNLSSNIRRTTSRTKEVFNDRDFLINFMNDDTLPILPKNMHLLTDDDTNQNIDDKTKFKNLADLLLDDKETVIESHFIKKVEDKMILKLYTALSRRAKDVFMEENVVNKDKNRILLHKLNNIKIQQFAFEDKDVPKINENINLNTHTYDKEEKNDLAEDEFDEQNNTILNKILKKKQKNYSPQKESKSNYLDDLDNIISSTSINPIKKNSLIKSQNSAFSNPKEKPHFLPDCKYNKKHKSVKTIKLPTLETYMPLRYNKSHSRRSRKVVIPQQPKFNQWEPDIDCDLLSYINHNIIKIEDIYNKGKENVFELKENQDEEIEPIEAKEVFFDINQFNNNNEDETYNANNKKNSIDNNNQSKKSLTNISEDDEAELKTKNKFCEYKDRTPNLIEISLMVEPDKKKLTDFHNELKELYTNRINEIGELDEDMFPAFGKNLKHNKIYKYAMNNERNEEINTDNFTLLGESTNLDLSKSKRELKLNLGIGNESMNSEENEENQINNNENNLSNKDSLINKDNNIPIENMNDLTEQKNEEEQNNSQKSQYNNILYEDESNNLYSLEDNNNNNLTNNNNEADNEKSDEYDNNDNYGNESKENNNFNNNDINMEENNDNDGGGGDHFLKISFSKNISN